MFNIKKLLGRKKEEEKIEVVDEELKTVAEKLENMKERIKFLKKSGIKTNELEEELKTAQERFDHELVYLAKFYMNRVDRGIKIIEEDIEKKTPKKLRKAEPKMAKTEIIAEKKEATIAIKSEGRPFETEIDKLLELVKQKRSLRGSEAAKILCIDEDKIEMWGRVLQEHGLLDVHYSPLDGIVLKEKKEK